MLQKRTFRHSRLAHMANWQSVQYNDVIKRIGARAVWRQKNSEPLWHCAACDPIRSLWQRNDEKHTSSALKRKRNGSRIMLRVTAGARQRVEDAEAAISKEQKHTETAENSGLMTRESEWTFPKMIVAIGESLSNMASSDYGENGKDENNEETEQRKLGEDDKPGWVMGTISKAVQQRIERFLQKQMKLDELTQLGWGDAANYFRERDRKYGTSELRVPAVVKRQTNQDVAAPALTTFGELMRCFDIVPGIAQMPPGTSRPGSSHMRLGSGNPQSDIAIPGLAPATERDSSTVLNSKPVEPVSYYPCI